MASAPSWRSTAIAWSRRAPEAASRASCMISGRVMKRRSSSRYIRAVASLCAVFTDSRYSVATSSRAFQSPALIAERPWAISRSSRLRSSLVSRGGGGLGGGGTIPVDPRVTSRDSYSACASGASGMEGARNAGFMEAVSSTAASSWVMGRSVAAWESFTRSAAGPSEASMSCQVAKLPG